MDVYRDPDESPNESWRMSMKVLKDVSTKADGLLWIFFMDVRIKADKRPWMIWWTFVYKLTDVHEFSDGRPQRLLWMFVWKLMDIYECSDGRPYGKLTNIHEWSVGYLYARWRTSMNIRMDVCKDRDGRLYKNWRTLMNALRSWFMKSDGCLWMFWWTSTVVLINGHM